MNDGIIPARPTSYDEKVGLVLQGGGGHGSYQGGVYEALVVSEYLPDWVAGISIGAINAAVIAAMRPSTGCSVCAVSGRRSPPAPVYGVLRPTDQ